MKDYPLIKVAILFITGIILNKFISFTFTAYLILALIALILLLTIMVFDKQRKRINLLSVISFIAIVGAGNAVETISLSNQRILPSNIIYLKNITLYGKISNIELNKEKGILFELSIDSLKANNLTSTFKTYILCRLKDNSKRSLDSVYASINPGNFIKITGDYSKGRDRRNPGEFDYNNYLNSKGISGVLNSYSVKDFFLLNQNKEKFKSTVFLMRKHLNTTISTLFAPQTAALVKGLLLADRSEIDQDSKVDFINSGVMHVLAVSGLHVGFIVIIFMFLFGRLNRYIGSILTISGLIIFMIITGMPASVVRAVIMSVALIISLLSNRSTNIFNSLSLAALAILLFYPNELFSPGFQLSFTAVFSIAAIYPYFRSKIDTLKINSGHLKNLLLFFAVSLSAQIGTLPFTLVYFSKLSVVALIANLIVIPTIGIIVGISFFSLTLNFFSPFFASLSAAANNLTTSFIFEFVKLTGRFQYSFLWIRNFTLLDSLIFYFFLIVFFLFMNKFSTFLSRSILLLLVFLNIFLFTSLDQKDILTKNLLNVYAIDVGQGDAFLLKFPNGKTALVDAGMASFDFDNGERVIDPLLTQFKIKKVDYAFISHFDVDHYGGFVSLIEKNRIEKVFIPDIDSTIQKEIKFQQFLIHRKILFERYTKNCFSVGNCKIYILNDRQKLDAKKTTSNNKSGIIKIVYGKTSALFTGDVDAKGEKYYAETYGSFLNSDVLKISHHGSNFCSSEEFLNCVKPKISLISVGIKNKFGHPSNEVLERLKKYKSEVIRTDKQRGILLKSDGARFFQVDWES
ncbi:MAG: DNA internalization-related competence protein ComEC/Rec2 [Ignavibacteriaceae bacterium]